MRLTIVFICLTAMAVGLPGRISAQDEHYAPEPRPLGRELAAFHAPDESDSTPGAYAPPEEPTGSIDLRTALALALAHNPDLAAFSWNARAVEGRVLQAALRPNPAIGAEVEDIAGTGSYSGVDQAQATITLSQLIELGGKRARRIRNAALERDLAGWDYEAKRIDVFTATATSFIDVLAEQQRVLLAEQAVGLAKQVVRTSRDRVKAGSSSRAELIKGEVAQASADIEREQALRALAAARQRLIANWGGTEPRFKRADGDLTAVRPVPELADLRRRVSQNPDLARWATEIMQREAAVALARSNAIPDVTLVGGYRYLAGPDESAFVAEVSIPLPLFDRNQGTVQEALQRVAQAREEQRSTAVRLAAELGATHEALRAAFVQIERLQSAILPGAAEAFETLRGGYLEGRFSYLDVLDAQRTLVAARQQHVSALAEYHRSVALVERLTGEPLVADDSTEEPGQ